MTDIQELKVSERDTTITPRQLRAAGYVPATLYGPGAEPQSIQVRAHEFDQLFSRGVTRYRLIGYCAGEATAQQVQRDPVSGKPLSVQFVLHAGAESKPEARQAGRKSAETAGQQAEPALAGV